MLENVSDKSSNYTRPDWNHSVSWDFEYNRHIWLRKLMDPNFDGDHEFAALREQNGQWISRSQGSANGTMIGVLQVVGNKKYGYASYGLPTGDYTGDTSRMYKLDGSRRVRQTWTPAKTMTITRFGLGAAALSGSAPIRLEIKQSGRTLHAAQLSGFPVSRRPDGKHFLSMGSVVIEIPNVEVSGDSEVHFELSTQQGSVFLVGGSKDAQETGLFTGGAFSEGHADVFNGSSWSNYTWMEASCNWLARPN